MARFQLSYRNSRHKPEQAPVPAGYDVHLRGWDAGVKVIPRDGEQDTFAVYLTSGSHATTPDILLGTVTDTPDGPVFVTSMGVLTE